MIRFRIGQSWKREPEAAPVDSFGLVLDGVDLLAGASEEPLAKVVPDLIEAMHALALGGSRCAQVSLAETQLELLFQRQELEVVVSVVSLARPARRVRPPLRLDLAELCQAAVRCAHELARDLSEGAPSLLRGAPHRQMLERTTALELRPVRAAAPAAPAPGFAHQSAAQPPPSFGLELADGEGLLLEYGVRGPWALPSLLCPGRVTLRLGEGEPDWRCEQAPFLTVLELSRQANELVGALEAGDEELELPLAGDEARLALHLREGQAQLGGRVFALDPARLARAMFELGLAFSFAAAEANKAQARNPYLAELNERCRLGLSGLRTAVAPGESGRAARLPRKKAGAAGKPLRPTGRLRRLRFDALWEKPNLGGEEPGQLLASPKGPIFVSAQVACGFNLKGALLFRREATHGVAASREGWVVAASATRTLGFFGAEASARWLRSHDGLAVGPELLRKSGLLVAQSSGRGVLAFCEVTGREAWRFDPPRTQRGYLAVQGHRALLAADSGTLFGLDLHDGQMRFRVQAGLPFACAPVPWGKKLLALLSRGGHSALFVADAHEGKLGWTHEMALAAPSRPLALGGRALVAGRQEGQPVLLCLGSKGKQVWERKLPLGPGALGLVAVGRDVVVTDAAGGAVRVNREGQVEWRLGAAGEELTFGVAPRLVRRVLVVPGETVRAVDPHGGQVLAEVRAGAGLSSLEVDAKLNLFLLDEAGTLAAHRLTSHFAVV